MNQLLRFTAISSLSFVINMGMLLLRAKVVAVLLAPEGVGLLSQLSTLDGMLSTFASVGLGYGIINLVAKTQNGAVPDGSQANVQRTGLLLAVAVSAGLTVLLVLTSTELSRWLVGKTEFRILFVLLALAVPFRFLTAYHAAVLQGLQAIKNLSLARIFGAVVGISALIIMTVIFGVYGAVSGIILWGFFTLIAHMYQTRKTSGYLRASGKFDIDVARRILRFGGANLVIVSMSYLAVLLIRTQIIHRMGAEQNGFYQVAWAISSQYLALVPLSLWSYGYPRLTELVGRDFEYRAFLQQIWRLGLLLLAPLIFLIMSNRILFIRLFYSSAFLPAADLIVWQVWGDVFRYILWWLELPLYSQGRLKTLILLESTANLGFLLAASILMPSFGIKGVSMAYLISKGLAVILALGILRKDVKLADPWLLFQACVLIAFTVLLPQNEWQGLVLSGITILVWLAWVLRREEIVIIFTFISRCFTKRTQNQ